jgi:hypothetical protein
LIDDQDSRPFDVVQGRESFDITQDRELVEGLVERVPGFKDSSEIFVNYKIIIKKQ